MTSQITELTLPIIGMDCEGCVNTLTQALMASEAIETVTITLEKAEAYLRYHTSLITKEEIIRLIEKAGFDVAS